MDCGWGGGGGDSYGGGRRKPQVKGEVFFQKELELLLDVVLLRTGCRTREVGPPMIYKRAMQCVYG